MDPWEQILVKCDVQYKNFEARKFILKYCLQNDNYFVSVSVSS